MSMLMNDNNKRFAFMVTLSFILIAIATGLVLVCDAVKLDKEGQYIKEMFDNGFKFRTYNDFESFFQRRLPKYNEQVRANMQDADEALVSSPIYNYASYELDIEPVTQLYKSYNVDKRASLDAMLNIEQLYKQQSGYFKQITKPTVMSLVSAIVWNQLQGLTEKLVPVVWSDTLNNSFNKDTDMQEDGLVKQRMSFQVQRLHTEMCQLLSDGQYQHKLTINVPDSDWFNCEDPENLRQFLDEVNTDYRATMAKLSRYAIGVYKRKKTFNNGIQNQQQLKESSSVSKEDIVREQPHQWFSRTLQQQLDPIFGIIDTGMHMLRPVSQENPSKVTMNDYEVLKERVDAKLSNPLLNYWQLVYKICKLVNSIRFGGHNSAAN